MPKVETKIIQDFLVNLGQELGFRAVPEYRNTLSVDYCPVYDVVWFIKTEDYNLNILIKLVGKNKKWESLLNNIPIAAFEIEGSTTTSKNQIGNFLNLSLLNSYMNFVIVNNDAASNEKDTYRRGVKICRTFMELSGKNNFIFLDWEYLKNIGLSSLSNKIIAHDNPLPPKIIQRSKVGGEKDSCVMDKTIQILNMTKLPIYQNFSPQSLRWSYSSIQHLQNIETSDEYDYRFHKKYVYNPVNNKVKNVKKINDIYYLPELDFALVWPVPEIFKRFLSSVSQKLKEQFCYYPILNFLKLYPEETLQFPIIGIEVESSTNKHLNGGVFNMSRFFYIGLLISKLGGQNNLNTLKSLGLSNVYPIDEEIIKGIII
ncbi:hypothetical protein [Clostridium sp.]|uniref:hypothetical protein n=1 Tax=Clostridium sp. TaxID=1506 RepID=UPI0028410986|nr:hypothetical protein [Clostridium sp.]MDR3598838.1 hypothetical protein [Clostridium sp.]